MIILFFVLWVIFNGRVTAEILLFGCLLSALLFLFVRWTFGWTIRRERCIWQNVPVFLSYVICLIWEIVKAALAVAGLAISPKHRGRLRFPWRLGISWCTACDRSTERESRKVALCRF